MSGPTVDRVCANKFCRMTFKVRTADVKRGWGRFCSKSCKASDQTRRTGVCGPYSKTEDVDFISGYSDDVESGFVPANSVEFRRV